MKVASLVQDLVTLPLRFVAALQPLGKKVNTVVDMLTDENVGLAEIHEEIITKNINNITKLTLLAVVGTGGLMTVCFLGAVVALVLGLSVIPVFWSLLALLMFGVHKSKRAVRTSTALGTQLMAPPT